MIRGYCSLIRRMQVISRQKSKNLRAMANSSYGKRIFRKELLK